MSRPPPTPKADEADDLPPPPPLRDAARRELPTASRWGWSAIWRSAAASSISAKRLWTPESNCWWSPSSASMTGSTSSKRCAMKFRACWGSWMIAAKSRSARS
jgi:hypothetical protein